VVAAGRNSSEILAAIERGQLDLVYLLCGEERFLIDRCLAALRRAVLGPEADKGASFNLDVFQAKERGLAPALTAARTLPMFARRRMVLVRGLEELKADDLEPLLGYVADPNPSTCLVLVAGGKVDGRLKTFQALRKKGYLHEFAHLRDRELPQWLLAEARSRKLDLAPEAAEALAQAAGPELGRLALGLEQTALYAGPGTRILPDHVEAVIAESRERSIFELTQAIGAGNLPDALRLLGNMLRNREPPLRIQFMLLRQLRQIWRAKELAAAGTPRPEIAAKVGMNPYFLDDVLVPARRLSTAALERSFRRLYQADLSLKSSRIDPELQIARLVRDLTDQTVARGG
jgi:DNA polymerase III subunit delta